MASIVDLCWTTAEDLMRDIDLDSLYVRQLRVLGGRGNRKFPYLILVFTGKITIGINLGNSCEGRGSLDPARIDVARLNEDAMFPESSCKDPWE